MDVGRWLCSAPLSHGTSRGLDETIRQQEIIYEPKRDLSEEKKNELDMKQPGIWNEDTGNLFSKVMEESINWSVPYIIWNRRIF